VSVTDAVALGVKPTCCRTEWMRNFFSVFYYFGSELVYSWLWCLGGASQQAAATSIFLWGWGNLTEGGQTWDSN